MCSPCTGLIQVTEASRMPQGGRIRSQEVRGREQAPGELWPSQPVGRVAAQGAQSLRVVTMQEGHWATENLTPGRAQVRICSGKGGSPGTQIRWVPGPRWACPGGSGSSSFGGGAGGRKNTKSRNLR